MNNLIMLPTAKNYLYHNRIKLNKETINEVITLVYDNISEMTGKQFKNLKKRLKIYEELKKLLPPGKQKLLLEYEELNLNENNLALEAAINYMLKNENEISEVLVNY